MEHLSTESLWVLHSHLGTAPASTESGRQRRSEPCGLPECWRAVVADIVEGGWREEAGLHEVGQRRLDVEGMTPRQAYQTRVARHPVVGCPAGRDSGLSESTPGR